LVGDPRFADREHRKLNRYELKAELEAALAERPATEWANELNADGCAHG
jgi:CoA:oxalate CoA-transferase